MLFVKNPLIKRGVNVKVNYVWGQGWSIRAQEPELQAVIDGFLYDQKNDDVFGCARSADATRSRTANRRQSAFSAFSSTA